MTCDICCEKYNKSTHAKVICPFGDCQYASCKNCVRTYLLGTLADPNCMKCHKVWDEEFLVSNLNRNFYEKEYKIHRKKLLLERELTRLPETMVLAERQKKIDTEEEKNKQIYGQIVQLNKQLNNLKQERVNIANRIWEIKFGRREPDEKRKFIMKCPNNTCRGFLSTQYKCDLCELFTCPACLEVVGGSKTEPHICNPDSVASTELIKKDTKPCPQCGVRIYKIDGCNQMWCTECRITFDYKTLKIDYGTTHNPHYYAFMREQNGNVPRNPQDIVCGGLVTVIDVYHRILNKIKLEMEETEYAIFENHILNVHRVINHITNVALPRMRAVIQQLENNTDIRIKYILGKCNKDEFGANIYRNDIKGKMNRALLHIYEILSVTGIENFNALCEYAKEHGVKSLIDEINKVMIILDNLRIYSNKYLAKISVSYNTKTVYISDLWEIKTSKRKISEIK